MKRRFASLLAAGTLALAAPLAANAVHTHRDLPIEATTLSERGSDSIWIGSYGSFSGWRAVARDQLILWVSPSRAYLVKVWPPASGLRFAETIGVTRTAGRVTKFENVIVDGRRLPIRSIERIDAGVARHMPYMHRRS